MHRRPKTQGISPTGHWALIPLDLHHEGSGDRDQGGDGKGQFGHENGGVHRVPQTARVEERVAGDDRTFWSYRTKQNLILERIFHL